MESNPSPAALATKPITPKTSSIPVIVRAMVKGFGLARVLAEMS